MSWTASVATRSDALKALLLAAWLWLPSWAVLNTDHVQGASDALALLAFSLLLLAAPLVLAPGVRRYFLLWTPLALLAGPYCYLTLAYGSVPGDALLSSALNTGLAMSAQVLASFGWKLWLVPLSLLLYLWLAFSISPGWRLDTAARKRLLACCLMPVMLALVARQAVGHAVRLPPLLEQSTINLAFPSGLAASLWRVIGYERAIAGAGFASVQGRSIVGDTPMLVVLVVGESLRSDHLGINGYARNTTPGLAALGPQLLSFPDVASTANWTGYAMPAIVSHATGKQRATLVPTFREAGFRTAWLSNQEVSVYGASAEVREYARNSMDFHLRTDDNLLPMFTSFVRQAGPRQFLVLHMIGSHIPYEERYSGASRVFHPTLSDAGVDNPLPKNKAEAINSYDNTVVETDRFLARMIAVLQAEQRPAVLVFTSDHGENLFDDQRQLFMHAQPGPTRYDTHVPLLVWMNAAYRRAYPAVVAALQANRAKPVGHASMFASVLELGAVAWQGSDARASFASPMYQPGPRPVTLELSGPSAPYESLK
ncbi:phosphoethanolamine transferase [Pseudoduganella aquatica]|uniref:Sulfatase-like hydrolase/transferase n=1 Tax=Pseudoduganella aquatica TaxID=2660641 RepID=A0A7X4H869_9BURK|nr:phosphoethanolamine transferase [Pseudoduganella aquatica]MYN06451.1 sulfatase-like hydrolase/transferase [Pseudoduganella aquatica]